MVSTTFARVSRNGWIAIALLLAAFVATLLAMDRPPICECGTIRLWQGVVQSSENSQQISDWYTFSHIIHGFIFYGLTWLVFREWSLGFRLVLALLVEGGWEILENSPIIIDRYRAVTMAFGYSGDSILNSFMDVIWMIGGFLFAAWSRIKAWWVVAIALAFELMTLATIRDNLTLNVWMLVAPNDAIRQWQAGAPVK